MNRIRWGVLSTSKFALTKVIPAMAHCESSVVAAIASRDIDKARDAADRFGIARIYGTYEELLSDGEIDVIYNPLPNHLHVPWSIRALEAGKHVLCEKPIGLSSAEAAELLEASKRHPRLKVMEAFMYRHHPQWREAKKIVDGGGIGAPRTIQSFFSYYNDDPSNIRNRREWGGGGLMDIGCYCISLSRHIFGAEPVRALGIVENDPDFGVDRMASGVLDFGVGTSTFTCSTQLAPWQRVNIFGTGGRVEIEIPFNAPPDRQTRLFHQSGDEVREVVFDICDQYTIQADLFSRAIMDDVPVPTPLGDAVANMRTIEALFESDRTGGWVSLR